MAFASKPTAICTDKQRLSDEVLDALSALTTLHAGQASDLIKGGSGLPRLDIALNAARGKWERAKQVYKMHVREHG